MHKVAALLLIFLSALFPLSMPASAATCPDFFRFVDFGIEGDDGVVYRGGSLFRAENFDGTMLLKLGHTKCLPVQDTAKDGRGNPIPVVTSIHYDAELTTLDVTELSVKLVKSATDSAERSAERHRKRLEHTDTAVTRGENFLCANDKNQDSLSCQIVSPYPGNTALVVYCDAKQCTMPVMAVDEQLIVNAAWPRTPDTVDSDDLTGSEIIEITNQIHDFLTPLTSLNPG